LKASWAKQSWPETGFGCSSNGEGVERRKKVPKKETPQRTNPIRKYRRTSELIVGKKVDWGKAIRKKNRLSKRMWKERLR